MKVHEYQAKQLFAQYGIPVPKGGVARTPEEAVAIARDLGAFPVVVKAQIHAGGRGKGGGIKLATSLDEVRTHAGRILGMNLVTPQTGPEGQKVKSIWVEQGSKIRRELYLAMVLDRSKGYPILMASSEGGMDIEEVAARHPEKIARVHLHPVTGLSAFHVRLLAKTLGLDKPQTKQLGELVTALVKFWHEKDASLVEINPLVVTEEGNLFTLDAKVNFDENALFRHPDVVELRDLDEEDPVEVAASAHNLSYVSLDGTVGCMVNGAGLAMATMDIIQHCGGKPANFLDVGGGANAQRVEAAFRIILKDPAVKAILVNIFGGIVRCDRVANGILEAAKNVKLEVPVVVRLQGTNAPEARRILAESGLRFEVGDTLSEAAEKVVAAARRAN